MGTLNLGENIIKLRKEKGVTQEDNVIKLR